MTVVTIDGVFVDESRAVLPLSDRAVLHGDSVFEVLRVYAGRPFLLEEHLERFERSAAALRFGAVDVPLWAMDVSAALGRFGGASDAVLRLMLTRGDGALRTPLGALAGRRVLIVEALAHLDPALYERGVSAVVLDEPRVRPDGASALGKYARYLPNLLALDDARARGADEALWLDPEGNLVEAATANVFVVEGDALWTAPLSSGVLAGITRAEVLRLASASGMRGREEPFPKSALARATEVFLTSSVREVVPVCHIDERPVGTGAPGPWTLRLHAALRERALRK
ncbi:MAG TPA: aminotransferase class IV [Polyangiaceae bacterium]